MERGLPMVAARMIPTLQPRYLYMPEMPDFGTPPQMSTPGARSHVPGGLFVSHQCLLHAGLQEIQLDGIQL
eukprot:2359786-Prorocentrum_lima.AAC.1